MSGYSLSSLPLEHPEITGHQMQDATRRAKIEAMLADDPTDTFLRYSLAMELQKAGEFDASLARF